MGKYEIVNQWYLQTGDVLCYRKKKLISRLIQIIRLSKINHASLVDKPVNDAHVYEAILPKFAYRTLKESLEGDDTLELYVKRPKFKFDKDELIKTIDTLRGRPYDKRSIWSQFKHSIWGGWSGTRNVKEVYCSEAVLWSFHKITGLFKDWYKSAPDDIFENEVDFEVAKELEIKHIK